MKGIDHKNLGNKLTELFDGDFSRLDKRMFLIGCVIPDKNPLTYLKGSIKYRLLHGHNYRNSKNVIRKYINKLLDKDSLSFLDYYCLGKLIHYVADTFTFAHNESFKGNLFKHIAYEKQLHRFLQRDEIEDAANDEMRSFFSQNCTLFSLFEKTHDEYLAQRRSVFDDAVYIYSFTGEVVSRIENKLFDPDDFEFESAYHTI